MTPRDDGAGLDENWQALFQTVELMRRVAIEVADHLRFTYPEELHERVVKYLKKVRLLDRNAQSFT